MCSVADLKADLIEYRMLASQTSRPSIKDVLNQHIERIETILNKMPQPTTAPIAINRIEKRIVSYGWDQSSNAVTIYLSDLPPHVLSNELSTDKIQLLSQSGRVIDVVLESDVERYRFSINNLLHDIDSATVKVKPSSYVAIQMKKRQPKLKWDFLIESDKVEKERSKPKIDPIDNTKDPSQGLMDMMKKMYEEGDDDMKRTIAKAWTESREKQMAGDK